MIDKVYQKFKYHYNKDITELLISRKWWGKAFWISIGFGGLSLIIGIIGAEIEELSFLELSLVLWGITLFLIIPILSMMWVVTYSRIKSKELKLERIKSQINKAVQRERARDYNEAITIWEKLNVIEEAARIRKLKAEQSSVRVAQKVVHGDEVSKTKIKDSILNRSNVGSGGKSKAEEIKEIKELLDSGAIDKDDYEKMKREIIG
jgi:uncharacterized membrane protein